MTTLESSIRIGAVVDQAVTALRSVKKEVDSLNQAVVKPPAVATGSGAAAAAAAKEAKEAALVRAKARKDELEAEKQAAREIERVRRQAAQQARQLAPQLTDITVGLATGQSPFLILLQQGGQLKDVFGGVGNAAKALASVFTPLRVIVGGVAAAIGSIGLAAFQGRRDTDALTRSLVLTGNTAATSLGQLDKTARSIATSQGAAIGDVRATLAALVAQGGFTQGSLTATARAVTAFAAVSGQSAEDAIKAFDGQADGVAAWAAKTNKAYNFLTAEQFKYIRSLEAQGRSQDALRVANELFASEMGSRVAPALGTLDKLWKGIGVAVSGVWDTLKAIGRDTGPEEKVAALTEKLAALDKLRNRGLSPALRIEGTESPGEAALRGELAAANRTLLNNQRVASERVAAAAAANKEITESSKEFQGALLALDQAGAQKRLAVELARLDAQRSAAEQANAAGLLGATEFALKINTIDQQRLQAQAATLQKQIEFERARSVATSQAETNAKNARVIGLEAQLVEVQSRIGAASAKARGIVAGAALEDARKSATEWAQVWERAASQVRAFAEQNDAATAARGTDPAQRAQAEADAKTANVRRQLAELQRDLNLRISLTLDPQQKALLDQQLQALGAEGSRAIAEATRTGTFGALQTQVSELMEALRLQEQAIEQEGLTVEQAEARKFAARDAALPQLQALLQAQQALASTTGERNAVQAITNDLKVLQDRSTEVQRSLANNVQGGFAQMFEDIATGSKSALGAFGSFIGGVARFALNLITQQLGKQLAASLLPGDGGGLLGGLIGSVGKFFGVLHTGGIVGAGGGAVRAASPLAWLGAPRYHSSGIVGLRPRERAIIAEDGEEVLDATNPRHIRNFKGGLGGGVNISVSVQGAQGPAAQQNNAGAELGRMVEAAVDQWATKQSRVGGVLSRRGA